MIELYGQQQPHSENLVRSLCENRVAVDKGKTGTGKTYCASWAVAQLSRPVGVICPIAVIPVWEKTLRLAGIHPQFVINYEKLRTGNTPFGKFNFKRWEWDTNVSPESIFIFDEFHRCKGTNSLNARIAAGSKPYLKMLLSATLAKDPTEMRALGYLTDLHKWTNHYAWCLRNGCWKAPFGGLQFKTSSAVAQLLKLNSYLFPKYGGGLTRDDLGDLFKKNTIIVEAYNLNDGGQIQAAYDKMETDIAAAVATADRADLPALALTIDMAMRKEVEMLKVPAFACMTDDLIEEGNSVVIGTNFRDSLFALCERLQCPGIYGGQNAAERQKIIEDFQADRIRKIVVNIQAGGVGISLHDLNGLFPRVSLLSPPNSAVDLIQFLGRIDRAGAQSNTLQKLIFAAGSVEEKTCARVQLYAGRIELLSDGDLAVDFDGKKIFEKNSCGVTGTRLSLRRTCPPGQVAAPEMNTETNNDTSASPSLSGHDAATGTPGLPTLDANLAVHFTIPTGPVPLVHANREHARLSPSTLRYKAICPGFINDPNSDTKWADRGSLGHLGVEKEDPSLAGEDHVLKAGVVSALKYKKRIIARAGVPAIFQEVRLDYFDQYGFTDLVVLDMTLPLEWSAELVDWKFAYNFHAADSPQFWAYCIGIWDKWSKVKRITVHTVHPFRGEADVEVFTRAEHYSLFSGQIAAIMVKADKRDPKTFRLSEICAYCGFAGDCPTIAAMGVELADRYAGHTIALPSGTLHGSEITDPDVFAGLLRAAPIVEKAAEGWRRAATRLWDSGTEIPGFQKVTSGGRRTVASAKAAFRLLQEHFTPDLTGEAFLDYCTTTATNLDELVAAAAPPRGKKRAKELLAAHLEDADLLTQGAGGSYLKAVKK